MNPKLTPKDAPLSASPRTLICNPLSKGSLGKTTFYEYLVAALEQSGISWEGANLDGRHHAFHERHPNKVKNFVSEGALPVDEYMPVFTLARRSQASVFLIDQGAQADRNFLAAVQKTGFISQAKRDNVTVVPVCVALDDIDYIKNLHFAVKALKALGITRWIIVRHPQLAPNDSFMKGPVPRAIEHPVEIEIPWVSNVTFARLAKIAADERRAPSFLDVLSRPDFVEGEAAMCRFELEDAMLRVERQLCEHAAFLLPEGQRFRQLTKPTDHPDEEAKANQSFSDDLSAAFSS